MKVYDILKKLQNLYDEGVKVKQTANPYKFKSTPRIINNNWKFNHHNHKFINCPRNCNSTFRIKNGKYKQKNTVKILNKIINDVNLTDEDIDKLLIKNNEGCPPKLIFEFSRKNFLT